MQLTSSLACANLLNLEQDINELFKGGIENFHFDFMDGHYVQNISLSFDLLKLLRNKYKDSIIDAHVMATNPELYIKTCADIGTDMLAVHIGENYDTKEMLGKIKLSGIKYAGIALNPSEPVDLLLPLVDLLDYVLVMAVTPGFSGQSFLTSTYTKIQELNSLKKTKKPNLKIMVDGGVDSQNGLQCKKYGADILVMGMLSVFGQGIPISQACNEYIKKLNIDGG